MTERDFLIQARKNLEKFGKLPSEKRFDHNVKSGLIDKEGRLLMTRIVFAGQDQIDELRQWIDQILEAVGHPEALVTDETSISDFLPDDTSAEVWLAGISKKLGVPIVVGDTGIVGVAILLRHKDNMTRIQKRIAAAKKRVLRACANIERDLKKLEKKRR